MTIVAAGRWHRILVSASSQIFQGLCKGFLMVHTLESKVMFLDDSFASIVCLDTGALNWLRYASCPLFGESMQNHGYLVSAGLLKLSVCSGEGQTWRHQGTVKHSDGRWPHHAGFWSVLHPTVTVGGRTCTHPR